MVLQLLPGTKCAICDEELAIDDVVCQIVDETGYVRIAHKSCV